MDDNTSIQFRLRLAQINGIKINEEQIDEADHHILARVSKDDGKMTQKSVIVTTKNRDAAMVRAERHFRDKGMKVHALKYVRQSDSAPYLPGSSNVREENQMNEEQIDEVKRSADYLHSTATEDQRAPTLKTYHTAMAKYSNLPPRAAHIKALNDTIDKHGVKNANQHVTKHFYSQMQKHLIDEDFEVGRKVNVTNPKATPRYEITDKDDTHYHLKNPDGKTMKLPKERIHRVNKSK